MSAVRSAVPTCITLDVSLYLAEAITEDTT